MKTLIKLATLAALSFATACATTGADDGFADADGESAAAGKVDVWQATDGQWHFHLKSGNGSILLTSEAYTSRTGAINGVLSTLENGVDPAQYETVKTATGYTLHLDAANGESIGYTEVYSTKSSATRAIGSCVKATTSYLDKRESTTTGARVEVGQGESGQYHFNMFAKNGQVVVSSESYTTEAAAYNGAFAVEAAASDATAFAVKTAADGRFYFTITALNGQVVGMSQMYTTKASAQAAVTSVAKLLPTISVL